MKFSAALLIASLTTTAEAFSIQHGTARMGTGLNARQPIMAGNWKESTAKRCCHQKLYNES
eukprot:scaffold22813_cov78-Cyclotella_meneghiniana.AAC.7